MFGSINSLCHLPQSHRLLWFVDSPGEQKQGKTSGDSLQLNLRTSATEGQFNVSENIKMIFPG